MASRNVSTLLKRIDQLEKEVERLKKEVKVSVPPPRTWAQLLLDEWLTVELVEGQTNVGLYLPGDNVADIELPVSASASFSSVERFEKDLRALFEIWLLHVADHQPWADKGDVL